MAGIELSNIAAGSGGFIINGKCAYDQAGFSVASAGDINGDGLTDLIISAPFSDPATGGTQAGSSYVVFGRTGTTAVELSDVAAGNGGFVINGQGATDYSGSSVASAGDVNGDGLADLIIGAKYSDPAGGSQAGRNYVVFGKTSGGAIELSAVAAGSGGFVINGQCANDFSGWSVATAGDVNGDGRADLIVGAPRADPAAGNYAGRSYVVFGQSGTAAINVSAVAAGTGGGFVINGECADDFSGWSVASAGDVNGDGLADLIVGAPQSSLPGRFAGGRSYVVFGKSGAEAIDLSAIVAGSGGFVINGQSAVDSSGWSVASAGDVNGDGLADLIVGAPFANPAGGSDAGRTYVVFGTTATTPIELAAVAGGNGGFVINGQGGTDHSGQSVSSAGDVNGDGLADLIIGAPYADTAGGTNAGRTYVVFGTTGTTPIELSDVDAGAGGFVINGACFNDRSGNSVASAGDINGDGLADLIVGAVYADPGSPIRPTAGLGYVIFGSSTGVFTPTAVDQMGDSGANTLTGSVSAETLVGGAGNDTLIGNGGADVLYGGSGNDLITVNAGNLTALAAGFGAGGNTSQLSRVDGGGGLDTLQLVGTGIALDLTAIANQGGGTPGSASRIESIESIDLTGSGNNTLTFNANDVADIAGMNLINSGSQGALGWSNGTYSFAATEGRHQLIIGGNSGDVANLGGGSWTNVGTAVNSANTYTVYNSDNGLAQVLIASAVTRNQIAPIELTSIAAGVGGFIINGEEAFDLSGFSVAGAGDVNGDGLADLIVGAPSNANSLNAEQGHSYVVFGKTGAPAINLSAVAAGIGGFIVNGRGGSDYSGHSVSSAGDINGDGLADLIVGAHLGDPPGAFNGGHSYVIFGKTATAAVQLSDVNAGIGGFVISGQSAYDDSGFSVASAGDVNGDGLSDLVVGAPGGDPAAGSYAGRSYVVFGKTDTTTISLSAVGAGTGGFVINGQCANDQSGSSVAGAGDVNGDGLADLIVGAHFGDPAAGVDAGRSYVVFGKADTTPIDLSAIASGSGGFVINGQCLFDRSGVNVSGAGDVNGDGLADLVVGAYWSDPPAGGYAGRSYVIFGKTGTTPIDLSAVATGTGGFVINGQCTEDYSGLSVSGAGDINGDGLADLIVGAPSDAYSPGNRAGHSYVVFGKTGIGAIDLSAVATGIGGFAINGQCANDYSGRSVAAAGDVNGDGLADLIVGAPQNDPAAGTDAGRSYVIFGSTTGVFEQTVVDQLGDSGSNTLTGTPAAETLVGGAGNDFLIGSGGADVLYGGSGNDIITVNAGNVAALAAGFGAGGNSSQLARIDGGTGVDTLKLAGAGITLDLTAIANQGGDTPGSASRIESVERIDLTGSGNNTLTLNTSDVTDIAGMNLINSGTQGALGWSNGTYSFAAAEGRHQLIIHGDSGDVANILGGGTWTNVGTAFNNVIYTVYNSGIGLAQLLVAEAVACNIKVSVDLTDVAAGSGGFVINGQCAGDRSGFSVSGAGDVNGDGLTDLIVGAHLSGFGRSYVIFGKTAGGATELSAVAAGSGGLLINNDSNFTLADHIGYSVSGAGDVNGDGLADLIVGADRFGRSEGGSYVVFGKTGTAVVQISAVAAGSGGFVINGQCAGDASGLAVAGAGDVNGDGLADLVVGALDGDPAAGSNAGRSYVVFGKTGTSAINLSAVAAGSGGFVINGQSADDVSGKSVASAGDVNGDGFADLIVGAPVANGYTGRSYVVFGKTGTNAIDLSAVAGGTGGFAINGQCSNSFSGWSVAGAGDVNGDGLADLVVGAYRGDDGYAGRSYVVFGKTAGGSIELSTVVVGGGGFMIIGQCAGDRSGWSVASAGDINGDGLADLIIGAKFADPAAGSNAGRSYVVFGKTGNLAIALSAIAAGSGGFVIDGRCAEDNSGFSVAGAGDVNGDGLADLIVGAPTSSSSAGAGHSYVIFGSTTGVFGNTMVDQFGDSGSNTLTGTTAAETLVGAAGNDTLIGNGGADILYGGAGNDTIIVNAENISALAAAFGTGGNISQLARVDGGGGVDTLQLAGAGVTLNLAAIANQGGGAPGSTSRIESIEIIDITGSGNNTLIVTLLDVGDISDSTNTLRIDGNTGDAVTIVDAGSAIASEMIGYHLLTLGAAVLQVNTQIAFTLAGSDTLGDVINGTSSADTILGLGGNDTLDGANGNDTLTGGLGNDSVMGGDGDDTVIVATSDGDDVLSGGNGFDTLDFSAVGGVINIDQLGGLVYGSTGNDTLLDIFSYVIGTSFNDVLSGGNQGDVLDGNDGDDMFFGNKGDDLLRGGDGNDTFYFSVLDGDDRLLGGNGFDVLDYSGLGGVVQVNQFAGTTNGTAGNDILLDLFEMVIGTSFGDVLSGGNGPNTLKGGGGDDQIFANGGDDYVNGGPGSDTTTFGPGNDTLDFWAGDQLETITDFQAGAGSDDTITLTHYSGIPRTLAGLQGDNRITQVGADTHIALNGGDEIILQNVTASALHQDDFVF